MLCLNKRYRYIFGSFLLLSTFSATPDTQKQTTAPSKEVLNEIYNKDLKKGIKQLDKGSLGQYKPSKLILLALKENVQDFSKHPLPYLLELLDSQGHINTKIRRKILVDAIQQQASYDIFHYLCKKKIYDPEVMKGIKKHHVRSIVPLFRIFKEIEKKDILYGIKNKYIKKGIKYLHQGLFIARTIFIIYQSGSKLIAREIGLVSFLIKIFFGTIDNIEKDTIPKWIFFTAIELAFSQYSFLFKLLFKTILVLIDVSLTRTIAPSYLALLLSSDMPKEDIEKIAMLFLAHGANVNTSCMLTKKQVFTSKDPDVEFFMMTYKPMEFIFIYPIHLAVELGSLKLVKEFCKRGASLRKKALFMKDKLDEEASPPTMVLVTFYDLYTKQSEGKTTYKRMLDFADTSNSELYEYLEKRGCKKSKSKPKPVSTEKTDSKSNSGKHALTPLKEA